MSSVGSRVDDARFTGGQRTRGGRKMGRTTWFVMLGTVAAVALLITVAVFAQSIDRTQNPNFANFGIAKSLAQQIGAGRGNVNTPDSSAFIIARDPARAVRRGRQ